MCCVNDNVRIVPSCVVSIVGQQSRVVFQVRSVGDGGEMDTEKGTGQGKSTVHGQRVGDDEGNRGVKRSLNNQAHVATETLASMSPVFAHVAHFSLLDKEAVWALISVAVKYGMREAARIVPAPQQQFADLASSVVSARCRPCRLSHKPAPACCVSQSKGEGR